MKRLLSLTLAVLCLVAGVPAAFAADAVTYDLPELNMTIDAPEGWIVFTRDVDEDDPNLALLGLDAKGLEDLYKENKIYLNMISTDPFAEIVVTMAEDDSSRKIYDFNSVPDAEMQQQAESLMSEMQELTKGRIDFSDCSTYEHKQAAFAVFHLTQQIDGSDVYGKQYTTAINGMVINITLQSYAGEISGDLSQILQNTIDSIVFTKVTSKPSTFDSSEVLISAGIGAAAGGIVGVVLYFIRKGRKKNYPPAATNGQPFGGPGSVNM